MSKQGNILDFDETQMLFGKPYKVNEYITITPPSVGAIIEFGEHKYFHMVHTLTAIPSDMISTLWDSGIDWEEIKDFDFFCIMTKSLTLEDTSLTFGDFDFSALEPYVNNETEQTVLANPITGAILDEFAFIKIQGYFRALHNIKPDIKHAKNKKTKDILIEVDRDDLKKAQNEKSKPILKPLISAMMRYPGFPYKIHELEELPFAALMEWYIGSQIYVSSTALLQGSYSGMMDTKKLDKHLFDWQRGLDK